MGKVSPQSIKYIIHAKFNAEGVVEKPDVIGAVFGQTEGLLGEDLELRELQKMGKIGRINVELEVAESKTTGTVEIPTSIDKAETTIIAAAIETIDRIGPCDATFQIEDIEDVRSSKREYILDRAKKLMEKLSASGPRMHEMQRDIMASAKTAKIVEYGAERLPAGPEIESSNELIVVEGRADILSLLRTGIKNCIAMNGTSLPKTIKELSQDKEVTIFVDGDRGGLLIVTDALQTAKIAFVARAPDGKEVEELSEKEVNLCLRARMTTGEFTEQYLKKGKKKKERSEESEEDTEEPENAEELEEKLKEYGADVSESKSILVTGKPSSFQARRIQTAELARAIYSSRTSVLAIVTNTATPGIIRIAEQKGCRYIVAKNFSATSERVKLLSI
jgi:DNA primase